MKTIELEVQTRDQLGKGANRRLRKQGLMPGVLYGKSKQNFNVQASMKTMTKILTGHNENAIITLKCPRQEINGKHVLVRDWTRNILTRLPLHADFYEIDMTKSVRVKIPLHFVGKAKGVVEGGLISPIIREIEVDCLPSAIPEFIEVDVSPLGIGDSIHIEELKVPDGVTKHFAENFTLVTCTFIKEEVIVTPDPAATTAEPEVIAKGKKEEEGEAPAGDKKAAPAAPAKAAEKADKK